MTRLHLWLGVAILLSFLVQAVVGLGMRIFRRAEEPVPYRALQHWTENLLVLQVVGGIIMLLIGRRVIGEQLVFLHYFYGSLFPLISVVSGRIASMRREQYAYVGNAWGAFFAFGLTTRALMVGLGEDRFFAIFGG